MAFRIVNSHLLKLNAIFQNCSCYYMNMKNEKSIHIPALAADTFDSTGYFEAD